MLAITKHRERRNTLKPIIEQLFDEAARDHVASGSPVSPLQTVELYHNVLQQIQFQKAIFPRSFAAVMDREHRRKKKSTREGTDTELRSDVGCPAGSLGHVPGDQDREMKRKGTDVEPEPPNAKKRRILNRPNNVYKPEKEKERQEGLRAAGFPDSTAREEVAVVKLKRRPDLATAMLGKQWDHGDPIFEDFKRCGGKGGGTVIYLDADTHELVLMVKITESKDLTRLDRTVFNYIFTEFGKGMEHHPAKTQNDAVVKGKMRVLNWREPAIQKDRTLLEIDRHFAESFFFLAPNLYLDEVQRRVEIGVSALGVGSGDADHSFAFCSELTYTSGMGFFCIFNGLFC
jgi:hypothetical protein